MTKGNEPPNSNSDEQFFDHKFDDPEAFSKRLDSSERNRWQKPKKVIESFGLSDDATVVEIGAGTGYFVVRLAEQLKNGKVIGLDQEPRMVEFLKKRTQEHGLTNVDVRLAEIDGNINLREEVDLVLCVDTYHHISERISHFSNYLKYLKVNGKLVIIDRALESPEGPPANHRISPETVIMEMKKAGFTPVKEADFLLPYQYYIAFAPTI